MAQQKRGWYWLALAVVFGLVAAYTQRRDFYGLHENYRDSQEHVQSLVIQRDRLVQEEETLDKRVKNLDSDPLEMEAAIRRSKGLVREGETVYRVELPEEASQQEDLFERGPNERTPAVP